MEEKDFEPTGLIPRSIIRTIDRFRQQLLPETAATAIQEFRVSRYQVRVSVRCFLVFLLLPFSLSWSAKTFIVIPLVKHWWNTQQTEMFLNTYQEERAFLEMEDFEDQFFFELLLSKNDTALKSTPKYDLQNGDTTKWLPSEVKRLHYKQLSLYSNRNKYNFEKQWKNETYLPHVSQFEPTIENNISEIIFSTPTWGLEKENQSCSSEFNLNNSCVKRVFNTYVKKKTLSSALEVTSKENLTLFQRNTALINLIPFDSNNSDIVVPSRNVTPEQKIFQKKIIELAELYNQESITAIANLFGDLIIAFSTILLFIFSAPQVEIFKSFLTESIYSLNDATKSFLLILSTDLLVGFHSPRGWEIAMEVLLRHLGLPENEDFILLFVGTFPVFLDTVFKYWIFRYLNKISPSTVATYHNMIE